MRDKGATLCMLNASEYSALERMRDGRHFEVRALRPEDRDALLAAVGRIGSLSLRRRFFAVKRHFTEKEIDFFTKVDFVSHVALVGEVAEEHGATIVAGARYIVVNPDQAELAFAVVDQYQGQGIGAAL